MSITTDKRGFVFIEADAREITPYVLLLLGLVSLGGSVYYSSYILAFIGLGLTFWGTLFLYIKFTKYVKLELLNAASISGLDNIERMLATTETDQKGIYLPPKNLQDHTSSLIFVPPKPNEQLPTSAETTPQKLQSENPVGLLLTPPGLALSKLFEKELKRPFSEATLSELQTQLPKLFEILQITKNLSLTIQANTITVEIRNHVFKDLSEETKKLEKTYLIVGSPLASALACVFAKATGEPITIEKEETTQQGTTTILYNILEK